MVVEAEVGPVAAGVNPSAGLASPAAQPAGVIAVEMFCELDHNAAEAASAREDAENSWPPWH
jgi:hypothetical protein